MQSSSRGDMANGLLLSRTESRPVLLRDFEILYLLLLLGP